MRDITTTITVYNFDELDDKAKETALDSMRHVNTEDLEWYDTTYETFKSKLTELGYTDAELRHSGFCSQGDGASFQADIDLSIVGQRLSDKDAAFFILLDNNDVNATIENSHGNAGRYLHENSKTVSVNGEVTEDVNGDELDDSITIETHTLLMKLETDINQERYDLSKELYGLLEKDYDSLISDEAVKDYIKDHEYEFTAEGHIYV